MTLLMAVLLVTVMDLVLLLVLLSRGGADASSRMEGQLRALEGGLEKIERTLREELSKSRREAGEQLKAFGDSSSKQIVGLTQLNEQKLDGLRRAVEERLKSIQEANDKKLEEMRVTVDEKLHDTLEKRLGESFKQVSERLERVHQGLGEMQSLAVGVGDLKKVLSNVKMRGTMGEIQLGNLLEQVLAPEQYAKNVATKPGSRERVEFAIRLPGRDDGQIWLPIDAKFPLEDYQRLLTAQEGGDAGEIERQGRELEKQLKKMAAEVHDKYIEPPHTTDFALIFLPFEGLYAEVLRRPGLCEALQREHRVSISGPTTIAAFLNSLQMGFRSLAIGKQASEVWELLEAVKGEFGKFGGILDKAHQQLQTVSNTIEDAGKKTRTIERKLKDVRTLPRGKRAAKLLAEAEEEEEG